MTNRKLLKLLNHYRNNQLVYQLISILLGALVLGLVIVVAMRLIDQRALPPVPVLPDQTAETSDSGKATAPARNTGLRYIIDSAYAAHGGRNALDSLVSMTRSGVLVTEQGEHEVVYTYKRPDLISYTVHRDNWAMRNAFDGKDAWRQIIRDGYTQSRDLLDPEITHTLRSNARLSEPFSVPLSNLSRLNLLEPKSIDGTDCYVIEYTDPEGWKILFSFDKETFLLFQRERISEPATDPSEQPEQKVTVRYDDYRRVEGALYGFEESVYINDEWENTFMVERLIINPGVIDSYFTPPPPLH